MTRHPFGLTFAAIVATTVSWQSIRSPRAVALTHVTVVDVRSGELRREQTVVIVGDRIASVGQSGAVALPVGTQVVNGLGAYVIPGLWDAHVHLSYLDACALPVFVANGITSVRDAGARLEDIRAWRQNIANGSLLGPRIKTAGPNVEDRAWLERAWKLVPPNTASWTWGPRLELADPDRASGVVDSLVHLGVDFVKFRNLPRESFLAVVAEAKRHKLPIAGHAPHGMGLAEASEAGITSIEHAETIMSALGSMPDTARLQSFEILGRNGTLVTPTLVTDVAAHLTSEDDVLAALADFDGMHHIGRAYIGKKTIELWRLSLDLKRKTDEPADWQPYYRREVADMRLARKAGVRFMAGTDVGGAVGLYPGLSVHDELRLLVKEVGLTPLEALQAATQVPPIFFGDEGDLGTIEPGKIADLVLLDANPLADIGNLHRIRSVVVGGRVAQRMSLDSALSDAAFGARTGSGCVSGAGAK
jgi:imidazolonepropionase-like amidohydrolase